MAVNHIFWSGNEGFDIHVVAGATSRRLDSLLAINHGAPPVNVFANAAPAGVSVRFRIAAFGIRLLGMFVGGGIAGNENTGEIAPPSPLPATFLHNFLIHAEVTDTTVVPNPTFVQKIRVHVHNAVRAVWLTPNVLTVRRNANGQRFSVLAEFDDDTVGDISRIEGLAWANVGDVGVDPATGALTATVDGGGSDVTVTLPATWGGGSATARANAAPAPWTNAVAATIIPGGPGAPRRADVTNFLFLPDGFLAAEQPQFEQAAQRFATFLRTQTATRPFDLCSGEINYWMAFVESVDHGGNTMYEIDPQPRPAGLLGVEIPLPVAPPTPPPPVGIWTLPQMIHEVGLPIPAQVPPLLPPFLLLAFAAQQTEWNTLFGAGTGAHVDLALYLTWAGLADRCLLDERNTAFGIAAGTRPNVEKELFHPARLAVFHPFRTTRPHVDQLLANLTDGAGGPVIGAMWATGGKDSSFVVVLSAGVRRSGGGGRPPTGLLTGSVTQWSQIWVRVAPVPAIGATREFELLPFPIPPDSPLDTYCMVAHESAHAMRLGDEYGGTGSATTAAQATNINAFLNLQDEASARAAAPAVGIDPALLKWNWPRITKAGVLAAAPAPAPGGTFRLTLRPGQVARFAVGDRVRLRARPLIAGIVPSGVCEVSAKNAAANEITIRPHPGVVIVPANFPANVVATASIVYVQRVVGGAPVGLIPPQVLAHIAANGLPLNATPPAPPPHVCTPDARVVQPVPAANRPAGLPAGKPRWSAWIVGAYEGGKSFGCGVFHPTGACVMRRQTLDEAAAVAAFKVKEVAYRFCPVCRYILVDLLDPSQHGAIDADYRKRYDP